MAKSQYRAIDRNGAPVPMDQGELLMKIETGMSGYGVVMPWMGYVYNKTDTEPIYSCFGPSWSRTLGQLESWVAANVG